ncbi:hypothetical protein [Dokdonella sp.]|uniref:hypothetical protein n=1 Tax=Dokdonella sp. TaxID=2291710 RepID=UPI003784C0DD
MWPDEADQEQSTNDAVKASRNLVYGVADRHVDCGHDDVQDDREPAAPPNADDGKKPREWRENKSESSPAWKLVHEPIPDGKRVKKEREAGDRPKDNEELPKPSAMHQRRFHSAG